MINTSFYGNENDWEIRNADLPYIKRWNYNTITAIENGITELNQPLDTSCAIAIPDGDFWGTQISYMRGRTRNSKYLNRNVFNSMGKDSYHYLCVNNRINGSNYVINSTNQEKINKSFFAPNAILEDNRNITKPYLTLGNNGNIKLLLCVAYSDDYESTSYTCRPLQDYINNYYNTHKYIYAIFAVPLFKTGDKWELEQYLSTTFGMHTNVWDYPEKIFEWYNSTNKIADNIAYNLYNSDIIGNVPLTYPFSETADTYYNLSSCFNIFVSGCSRSRNDYLSYMESVYNYEYYSNIGFIPNFESIAEGELIRENGVALLGITYGGYSNIQRFIDLSDVDFWGDTSAKFEEFCKKQCAYFGMYFITDYRDKDLELISEKTYLGIMEESGVTRGNYSKGLDNYKQINYDSDIIDLPKENPKDLENDKGDLTSKTNKYLFTNANRLYLLNEVSLTDLMNFINIGYQPNSEQLTLDFKGKNPIDYIISCNIFPFDISSILETQLFLGGVPVKKSPFLPTSENVVVKTLGFGNTYEQKVYNFGSVYISEKYGDFRDYEPFSKCELQLPFCDTYSVDLRKFTNKNLSVRYVVDFQTGACTAYIFMNDLIIDSVNGQIGYSINLSGIAQGDYQNTIQRNNFNMNMAKMDIVKNFIGITSPKVATNPPSVISTGLNTLTSVENAFEILYENQHFALPPTQISVADAINSFYQDMQPRLIFYRAKTPNYNKTVYANTVGYACLKTGLLSDFSGYTKCSNVKININCSETEKQMIQNALINGVYN